MHKPQVDSWKAVVKTEHTITLMAMCECGDQNCAFVLTAFTKDMIHIPPARKVWSNNAG